MIKKYVKKKYFSVSKNVYYKFDSLLLNWHYNVDNVKMMEKCDRYLLRQLCIQNWINFVCLPFRIYFRFFYSSSSFIWFFFSFLFCYFNCKTWIFECVFILLCIFFFPFFVHFECSIRRQWSVHKCIPLTWKYSLFSFSLYFSFLFILLFNYLILNQVSSFSHLLTNQPRDDQLMRSVEK